MNALVLLATVAGQTVAIDATQVESVIDIGAVVPVPSAPKHILGLAAIRSQVVTVIDCAAAVGEGCSTGPRAIVVRADGHRYALLVDAVDDVVTSEHAPETGGAPMKAGWARVSRGRIDLGDQFAVAVDPAQIVAAGA